MKLVILLIIIVFSYAIDSSKYFKASIQTRIKCTRGVGISNFLENEIRNYPMIIFMINQEKNDIISFYDVSGVIIEELIISNYSIDQIVDSLDKRGFRQFYEENV